MKLDLTIIKLTTQEYILKIARIELFQEIPQDTKISQKGSEAIQSI